MVVIGTDLFVIGGKLKEGGNSDKTYGYRLNKTGTWYEVKDFLTTKRAGAACFADKVTKDIFVIGGNAGSR